MFHIYEELWPNLSICVNVVIDKLQTNVCLTMLPIGEIICKESQDYFWINYWMGDFSKQS